ncbi:MAG: ASCH/PUA domain-containing protein [Planctomycetota bacterium JB042]
MTAGRAPRRHDLKTWPEFFAAVEDLRKTFEVRRNDRDFREGDELLLREWDPETEAYSGRELLRRVSFVYDGAWIAEGYVVLGLAVPTAGGASEPLRMFTLPIAPPPLAPHDEHFEWMRECIKRLAAHVTRLHLARTSGLEARL